jgi:DNA-binding NtrC family response regulator
VGELSLSAQVRLLRVLANREIERVGGTQIIPLNIRVITATHRDLKEMVKAGRFREDLWFRLNVFPIVVPPLRYRKEDIPELTEYFLGLKSREFGISPPSVSALGLRRLTAYDWPGNVRELENVIEREMICSPYQKLDFKSLNNSPADGGEADEIPTGLQNQLAELLPLEEVNIRYIQKVLRLTNGKVSGPDSAADILRINPGTLRSRMSKYKINRFGEKK